MLDGPKLGHRSLYNIVPSMTFILKLQELGRDKQKLLEVVTAYRHHNLHLLEGLQFPP